MENQLAGCAVGFNPFRDALEADALLLQLGNDLHQVRQAAPEAV